jgi:hypothetical protein
MDRAHDRQQKIKQASDRKSSKEDFQLGYLVLKWDAPKQDKRKHGKFESLWIVPLKISERFPNNTHKLQNSEGDEVFGGPVNGHFLKKNFFLKPQSKPTIVDAILVLCFFFIEDSITQRKALELCVLGSLQGACYPLWSQC